ncbi:1-acyl-sn-glycerol-3-phosphate acyltransferase [Lacibacter cauensis]|uniref:1-acyl-sn-glycerol-3-phosphate acyltransferase n=1 Tax=Lacibacter cauensis TaxID=510947 RepID=A0A562SUY4_9BACT|nr:lysophospholipid acyltransferase family protein [Lacibacter cauensis]TWI85062.1 1-acyl-sn-glycerol-3-phosphate acyltransferase [Lacibacter cauensis]
MQLLKNILGRFFAAWAMLTFIATMLIVLIPTAFLGFWSEPKRTILFIRLSRIWMAVWLPLAGIRLIIKGREKFAKGENYVVVCNHNSFMDVPVTSPGIPGGNKTIAKIEMARIPLFGLIYKRGSVLVDRKSEESRLKSYTYMKRVLEMGLHMCIYPEGTRNKTNKPLKEFKDGAFRLAIETGKPVIPAVLFNTKKVLPQHKAFYFWPSTIEMHFLDPVTTEGLQMTDVKQLKETIFNSMWQYYETNA